jgi:hypothetical protein
MHSEEGVPEASRYFPAGQSMQGSAPTTSLFFPAEHKVHMPPSGCQKPMLQTQLVLPACEEEFVGQVVQVLLDEPTFPEYLPDSQ